MKKLLCMLSASLLVLSGIPLLHAETATTDAYPVNTKKPHRKKCEKENFPKVKDCGAGFLRELNDNDWEVTPHTWSPPMNKNCTYGATIIKEQFLSPLAIWHNTMFAMAQKVGKKELKISILKS